MNGFLLLLILILISALPVLGVHIWFRVSHFPLGAAWFLISLLSGVLALLAAALLQSFFPPITGTGMGTFIFKLFVQIALTEEMGRFLILCLLFRLGNRLASPSGPVSPSLGAATGLLSGLGFAVVETASYGAADMGIALLRAFTAAPLHGACGSRVGLAVVGLGVHPGRSVLHFLAAVALHGMYNFMIINPGMPIIFPVLLAFVALASSIQVIRSANTGEGAGPLEKI
jgi:RsiW-degrading membrane proteinase PrsW (M82 family)